MPESRFFTVENMYFNAIHEIKIITKISGFTVCWHTKRETGGINMLAHKNHLLPLSSNDKSESSENSTYERMPCSYNMQRTSISVLKYKNCKAIRTFRHKMDI